MSFRERSAWISFLLLLLVFAPFFWNAYRQFTGGVDRHTGFGLAVALLAAFVVLEVVLHAVHALRAPREARTPRDERERMFDMRATSAAYQVLVAGALAGVATIHVTRSAWVMQQVVLLAIVVSQLVRFGGQILLFRRDA
jgi:hypothetical protein